MAISKLGALQVPATKAAQMSAGIRNELGIVPVKQAKTTAVTPSFTQAKTAAAGKTVNVKV